MKKSNLVAFLIGVGATIAGVCAVKKVKDVMKYDPDFDLDDEDDYDDEYEEDDDYDDDDDEDDSFVDDFPEEDEDETPDEDEVIKNEEEETEDLSSLSDEEKFERLSGVTPGTAIMILSMKYPEEDLKALTISELSELYAKEKNN